MTRRRLILPRWETPEPPGVAGTYGDRAIRWAKRELGITPGPWQAYEIRKILRHDKAGDLLARIALLSTGRQNGKSVIVRTIVGWFLDEGRTLEPFRRWTELLAAAHDAKQARVIYEGVFGDVTNNDRMAEAMRITRYRGITSGPVTFDTVTSQPGSVRGHSAGLIAWDEVLTQEDYGMWEALAPTQSAQRSPLMLLTSTAGHQDSLVLRNLYLRLVRIASGDEAPDPRFYGAWWQSEDPTAGLDWRQVAMANPGLGDGRLTRDAITNDHRTLPPDSWSRERLNHWQDTPVRGALPPGAWAANQLADPLEGHDDLLALGVDVNAGWDRATIAVAGRRRDGRIGAELYRDLRAADGKITPELVIDLVRGFPEINRTVAIAFDLVGAGGPAFARAEQADGLPWTAFGANDVVAASMDVTALILATRLAVDDPLLTAQLAFVDRRPIGAEGAFRFSRQGSTGPIDAWLAMSFAIHAIARQPPPPQIV